MKNVEIISVWRAEKEAGHYVGEHTHKYHELVFYVQGNGASRIEGTLYPYTENTYLLMPPGARHDDRNDTEADVICLEFACDTVLPLSTGRQPTAPFYRLLRELLAEVQQQSYGYREMCAAKITELCLLILREKRGGSRGKDLAYIANYIAENYGEKLRLTDCAARLNVSYDYFQHAFRKHTGLSPQAFLIQCRLEAARHYLQEETLNCTEIAYRCGFSTSAQFSALFKRRYGVTPLRYRKQEKRPL